MAIAAAFHAGLADGGWLPHNELVERGEVSTIDVREEVAAPGAAEGQGAVLVHAPI